MSAALIPVAPDVLNRLLTLRRADSESLDELLRRILPPEAKPGVTLAARRSASGGDISYVLLGEMHAATDATDAMIAILRDLAQYDDEFFPKLAAKVQGRTRNHVARSRLEVYPGRPDLARYVKKVGWGWFVGCNIANREKQQILRAACNVMGLAFERDLQIDLKHA